MPVNAVIRGIQRSVFVPSNLNVAEETRIFYFRIRLEPVQPFALFTPEAFGMSNRTVVHLKIFLLVHPSFARDLGEDRIQALMRHQASSLRWSASADFGRHYPRPAWAGQATSVQLQDSRLPSRRLRIIHDDFDKLLPKGREKRARQPEEDLLASAVFKLKANGFVIGIEH